MRLTEEQERIVAGAASGQHMKVKAYAGTGKTSTSVAMSERALANKRGLYLAFNKSIATEAASKMPGHIEAKTAHSLAYRATMSSGRFSRDRLQPGLMPLVREIEDDRLVYDAANALGGEDARRRAAMAVAQTITRYCQSDRDAPSDRDVPRQLGAALAEKPKERARRYLVRSWFDIAGLRPHTAACFRLPGRKQSNIRPASVWSRLPERIDDVGIRLRDVEIRNTDAVGFIESQNTPDTLVYADPPYVWETRQNQRYYNFEMSDADHRLLLETLIAHSGPAPISGYDSALYRDALEGRGWVRHEFPGRAQNRRPGVPPKKEIVWRNPIAVAACEDARIPLFDAG